jgi:hypothetical protein
VISVGKLLDDTRDEHGALPRGLALRLLRASIRLAAGTHVSLRPRLLLMDEQEDLTLDPGADPADEDRPGYAAPEVSAGLAAPEDPQAMVYTAGALGYELFTLRAVPDRSVPTAAGLPEWLAAVLRKALAPRHRRFKSLAEMDAELGSAAAMAGQAEGMAPREAEHFAPRETESFAATATPPDKSLATPGDLAEQLRLSEERAAELEHTLTARDIAAAEKTAELQLAIDALQERVRLLTFIANATARAPRAPDPVRSPPPGRHRRRLIAVSAIVMMVAAIAASVLAIRGDGPARETMATPSDAHLIKGASESQAGQR